MRSSRAAPIWTSGACCLHPAELRAFLDRPYRRQARAPGRDSARRQSKVRRELDLLLERPAAQRRRRDLLLRDRRPQEHHGLAARRARIQHCLTTNGSTKLLNPTAPGDPDGFLIGVNWRGTVSASQTPALQAAQNTAQVFLGVNLKCNSCHDSFISKWKLKDAYSLAAYFSDGRAAAALPLRCRAGAVRDRRVSCSRNSTGRWPR